MSLKDLAECCGGAEVSEAVWTVLQRVLQIEEFDIPFWYFVGSNLLEPYFRLSLLLGQNSILAEWQTNIANKANPKELIVELDAATSAFLSDDENPEHVLTELKQLLLSRTTQPDGVLNQIKLEVVSFLAPLLSRLTIPDLKWAFEQSFRNYHSLLLYELERVHNFLGSPHFAALFDVFRDKKDLLFEGEIYEKGCSLVLTLLSYYAVGRGYTTIQAQLVRTVTECGGSFAKQFEFWKSRFPTEVRHEHSDEITGLVVLALEIQQGHTEAVQYPLVYSNLRRAQYFVPLAGYVLFGVPEVAVELLEHSVEHLDVEFTYLQTPLILIGDNKLTAVKFSTNFLDFIGGASSEKLRNRALAVFKQYVWKYSSESRQVLLKKLITEYIWDKGTGMMIDWYRENMAQAPLDSPFLITSRFVEIMKHAMKEGDAVNWLETIHAAASMLQFVLMRDDLIKFKAPEVLQTIFDKYVEPVGRELTNYFETHQDHTKIAVILGFFTQIREQVQLYKA
eukprot:CAMPEP_0204898452 /NCGR_PEP_ID=MMETSP1397-20131031/1300_1 /ASSEMBLY_ACC=CAM_ASM_000891 /TAXON_ID=49980 /ORGANISM="Climacostomum Climacostomum virens, Strain Stock W-24" /LENGTH=506 /DNA_ID=CAMNT_0052066309 /DNA_START=1860 /DNA_END=3380 /DNA_ORIENTATION=-